MRYHFLAQLHLLLLFISCSAWKASSGHLIYRKSSAVNRDALTRRILYLPSSDDSDRRHIITRIWTHSHHQDPSTSSRQLSFRHFSRLRGGGALLSSKSQVALSAPPPLSAWILPGSLCALAYALYNLSIKQAATHKMDPLLGGVVLQFIAASLGTFMYIIKLKTTSTAPVNVLATVSRAAWFWSVAAGISVGAAEILSFYVSSKGVQAMQSIPVIIGGSVLLGTVLGSVWMKESMSLRGWLGVLLIGAGIALVGMDSASSMH